VKINERKMATLASSGIELIKVATNLLIDGIAFILFNGLSTLKFLRAFRLIFFFTDINIKKISSKLNKC
jgi:hypothetical protein